MKETFIQVQKTQSPKQDKFKDENAEMHNNQIDKIKAKEKILKAISEK